MLGKISALAIILGLGFSSSVLNTAEESEMVAAHNKGCHGAILGGHPKVERMQTGAQ